MTEQELIERAIESAKCRIYRVQANSGSSIAHQKKADEQALLQTITIKALEKQIAKKPVKRSFIVPYEGINVCPSCKEPLPSSKEHHCKCGQKLDWGNEDAE